MLSPRKRLEASFAPYRAAVEAARAGHYTMPIMTRHHVFQNVDPRHVGKVVSAHCILVTVRWENGWTSQHRADELTITGAPQ